MADAQLEAWPAQQLQFWWVFTTGSDGSPHIQIQTVWTRVKSRHERAGKTSEGWVRQGSFFCLLTQRPFCAHLYKCFRLNAEELKSHRRGDGVEHGEVWGDLSFFWPKSGARRTLDPADRGEVPRFHLSLHARNTIRSGTERCNTP